VAGLIKVGYEMKGGTVRVKHREMDNANISFKEHG
jgi:hypothetical protein